MSDNVDKCASSDDPNRCQAAGKIGQCSNLRIEGSKYCMMHGGAIVAGREKKEAVRNYQLGKWQARVEKHADSEIVKSLREEIGILRIMLETRFEQCEDAQDLLLQSGPISELVLKVEKLVTSCDKLEGRMGNLLDKQAILNFASQIIDVIANNIDDEAIINKIADEIITIVGDK